MKELQILSEKYWEGVLTPAEKERLFQLLGDGAEEKGTLTPGSAETNRQDAHYQSQWSAIKERLGMDAPKKIGFRRWYAAAAVLILAAGSYWFFTRPVKTPAATTIHATLATIFYTNEKAIAIDSLLPDGSEVRLYPKSALSFNSEFNGKRRDIYLRGKALFNVRKDSAKPFTVYAEGFSTTALGTKFEVTTTDPNSFSVSLINGKVVVRSTADKNPMTAIYLKPGERLVYDRQQKTASIASNTKEKNEKPVRDQDLNRNVAPELTFSNLPLNLLFRQLEQEYSILIICDEQLTRDRLYTGSFRKSDNPTIVIEQIVKPYHLHVHKSDNVFRIE